jgi:SAM-dependent methyltransferase
MPTSIVEPMPDDDSGSDSIGPRFDFVSSYEAHTRTLLGDHPERDQALKLAVGSSQEEFFAIGAMQKDLLVAHGLVPESSVIEIGCGSGRLAVQLQDWLKGPYLGTDVVQALLDHASTLASAPNMRFQRVTGLSVPAGDDSADMVCAFSVFTHLLHEQSFVYMEDCRRVLRAGGKLVFSFLEFRVPSHWDVMRSNISALGTTTGVLNQFMSVDGIEAWAQHLNFDLIDIFRGDSAYIPLSHSVVLNGHEFQGSGTFGQSSAVLQKPSAA